MRDMQVYMQGGNRVVHAHTNHASVRMHMDKSNMNLGDNQGCKCTVQLLHHRGELLHQVLSKRTILENEVIGTLCWKQERGAHDVGLQHHILVLLPRGLELG